MGSWTYSSDSVEIDAGSITTSTSEGYIDTDLDSGTSISQSTNQQIFHCPNCGNAYVTQIDSSLDMYWKDENCRILIGAIECWSCGSRIKIPSVKNNLTLNELINIYMADSTSIKFSKKFDDLT